ncbi:MAG TPA: hypothetical protein VI815_04415, partial [Candidatus Nanoarchaeia archaeon]|nr:hypothetical protein [Candidatus Nanoarchaeia archaeon]
MKHELFCEECGKILDIKHTREGRKFGICKCGFVKEVHSDIITTEKTKNNEEFEKQNYENTEIIEQVKEIGFPHKCKKCGYEECEVYDLGASYSDEANVYLFKCLKCGHV